MESGYCDCSMEEITSSISPWDISGINAILMSENTGKVKKP